MRRFLSLAGLVLFAAIVASAGPREILESLRGARPLPIAAGLLGAAGMVLAKSWRWALLLRGAGLAAPLGAVLRYFLVGNFLGLATPARVGDFAKALYFAGQGGNSFARASASVFVDRVLDVIVLVLLGLAVLLQDRGLLGLLPVAAVALLLPLYAAKRRIGERVLRHLFGRISPDAHRARVDEEFVAFYAQVSALLTRRRLAVPLGLAAVAYAMMILGVAAITRGLGLALPLSFIATSVMLAIFVALLPISIGGLGSREAVLVACFGQRGLAPEIAVSVSILFFLFFYLVPATTGAVLWQGRPVPIPGR